MKKFLALAMVTVMVLSMAACGKDKGNNSEGSSSVDASQQESESAQAPEPVSMDKIKQAVVDALGENYWPQMALDAEMLQSTYGVSADLYDAFLAEMPMMSAHIDSMVVIQAKADKVKDVETALTNYRKAKVEDTMVYPSWVGKIQASQVAVVDNYVCLLMLGGDTMDVEEQGDDAVIKHCKAQNEKALEAIKKAIGK